MSISDSLREDLISITPIEQIFQKHVIDGASYFFKEKLKELPLEYELRHELAQALNININDVVIVGSAKLGFSLKTDNFFEFDYEYLATNNSRRKSDIDIAIVNRRLYDNMVEEIFHLSRHFDRKWINHHWKMNAFYRTPTNLYMKYALYLARGWLRPDFLPNIYFDSSSWKPISDIWYGKLSRKISLGFYSDWIYLKHYQMDNLEKLRIQLSRMG